MCGLFPWLGMVLILVRRLNTPVFKIVYLIIPTDLASNPATTFNFPTV